MELEIKIDFRGGETDDLDRVRSFFQQGCKLLAVEIYSEFAYDECSDDLPYQYVEILKLRLVRKVIQHRSAYTLVQIFEGYAKLLSIAYKLEYSLNFSLDED